MTAEDGVAILTLNQPEILNAVSARHDAGALAALDFIESEPKFRALVLTGAGKGFLRRGQSGAEETAGRIDAGAMLERVFHPFLRRLRDFPMPVVMAVNGPAVGIGMSFALSRRSSPRRPLGLLPAGLFQNRAGAGWRLDLAAAAPDRAGAGARTGAAGGKTAGRERAWNGA